MIYTQEQLESMSDIQIDAIIFTRKFGVIGSDKDMQRVWNSKKISYCNNWADIGPLMTANCISIEWDAETEISTPIKWCNSFVFDKIVVMHQSNPLRAAAIVYILIKQGE